MNPAQDPSQTPDPLWGDFESAEFARQAQVERDYRAVEGYNAHLLNQVAGIEDIELTLVEKLSDGPSDHEPGSILRLNSTNSLLYLRPDRREELHKQNEHDKIHADGDPHTIAGPIPVRTQKLIDDLLASTEAKHDATNSTASEEVWRGNVAGQPIKFVKYHQIMRTIKGDVTESTEPLLSIRIYRESTAGDEMGKTAVRAAIEAATDSGVSLTDTQLDSLDESVTDVTNNAVRRVSRNMKVRPRWLRRLLS